MTPTARLTVTAAPGHLEELRLAFDRGPVLVMLETVELKADGELLRDELHPRMLTPVSCLATDIDLPAERTGPLVQVHATCPARSTT